jgi:hypothetical protein
MKKCDKESREGGNANIEKSWPGTLKISLFSNAETNTQA